MLSFIGFGKCSKYYIYIFGTVIFKCLRDCLFGFNNINPETKIGLVGFIPKLSNHHLIQSLYKYFSFIFGGAIFSCILKKEISSETGLIKSKPSYKLKGLIHNKKEERPIKKRIPEILIISLIYCFHSELSRIMYLFDFGGLDFWTFDVMFIFLFMELFFIIDYYKHQKLSMAFIIIVDSILLLISSLLPLTNHEDGNYDTDNNSYKIIEKMIGNNYSFIFGFAAFIFLSCILSYGRVKQKVLMDFYYLSPYILIIFVGIFGFILTSIILAFTTFFECPVEKDYIKRHCYVKSIHNNITKYYYDNIIIYFDELKNNEKDYTFYLEITFIPLLFFVINFLEFTCEILAINFLNPNYILVRDNLYYGLSRLIFFLFNLNKNFKQYMTLTQFIILEASEVLGIIGYSVYFELIELRFCGLDKDLKRNIIKRGERETILKSLDSNLYDNRSSIEESFINEEKKNNFRNESNEVFQ